MEKLALEAIKMNIMAAGVILLARLLARLFRGKLTSTWKYVTWLVVALFLLIPVRLPDRFLLVNVAVQERAESPGDGQEAAEALTPRERNGLESVPMQLSAGDAVGAHLDIGANQEIKPDGVGTAVSPDGTNQEIQSDVVGLGVRPDGTNQEIQPDVVGLGVQPDGTSQGIQSDVVGLDVQPDGTSQGTQPESAGLKVHPDSADSKIQPDDGERTALDEEWQSSTDGEPLSGTQSKGGFPGDRLITVPVGILHGFLLIWLAGAVLLAMLQWLLYCFSMRRLRRWSLSERRPDILSVYRSVCEKKGIDNPPRLMTGVSLATPLLSGLRNTRLYLPTEAYSKEELRLIFHHELSHYQAKDLWYKTLLLVVSTIYWFNPFLHMMQKEAEKDIENLCDSRVIRYCGKQERASYNRLLLKTAALQNHVPYVSASLNDSVLVFKERIRYMVNFESLKSTVLPGIILTVGLLCSNMVIGCSINAAEPFTNRKNSESLPDIQKEEEPPALDQELTSVQREEPLGSASSMPVFPDVSGGIVPVHSKLQLHNGGYVDERYWTTEGDSFCDLSFGSIGDTSFQFTLEMFIKGDIYPEETYFSDCTAYFVEDGTMAVYKGEEYTLYFTFPDYHDTWPEVQDIVIYGYPPLEGRVLSVHGLLE